MRIRKLFVAALLAFASTMELMAQGPNGMTIPMDTAVATGTLPNGLTYYVRHNSYPEHRVNFYIAQRVGSIQENDDQQGLAHFLEHMAFNGSENYPNDRLLEYLRSIGVEFGSDLNAYTGVDETVYRICNVPSGRTESLDSCLLVLKDWSNGLTLDAKEIDKERGVIHDEWRQRSSSMMRILSKCLPQLYPGSKYGLRLPIGKMEIVDNFKPKALRDYYHKWYRPDNQAIIVVGDVDVKRTVAKINEMFSGIKMPENPAKVVAEAVPDNPEAIIIVEKDKELSNDMTLLFFKHDAFPDSLKSNMNYLIYQYVVNLSASMLNSRFGEIAQNADCPFVNAGADDGDFILSKTKGAFELDVVPKQGQTEQALAAALREAVRAAKYGFTATEYARAKAEYMSRLEKVYTNRNKRENSVYGDICRDNFLDHEPMPSITDEYQVMQMLSPNIPVEVINQTIRQLVSLSDTNLVVLSMHTEKEGAVYPTAESLKKAIDGVHAEQLSAWVDNVKNEPLIPNLPTKGKILKEKTNSVLGYKELSLSNGAKVILKKTDFKDDEIVMEASSKGGSSLYGEADFVNTKMFGMAVGASGLGGFSNTELEKALAGKQASVSLQLNTLHEIVNGKSTPKDLETMFQLTYLTFTDIRKDEKGFNALMAMLENALKNRSLSPDAAFSDSVTVTFRAHNPRFAPFSIEQLKQVDYDRILQIAKERTANAGDFTFIFAGNFDEDSIRPLIEQYIASLPATGKKETWKKVSTYPKGNVENRFSRKMETPNAKVRMAWFKTGESYSLDKSIMADAAGQVLNMVYLKKIREDAGASYSPDAAGWFSPGGDTTCVQLIGSCPMNPDKIDVALKIMDEETANLGKNVDSDMLNKVKELMLKRADEDAKKNSYWLGVIGTNDELGIDTHTNYKKLVNELTPAKVAKFVNDTIVNGGSCMKVIMLPE